jgi:hypothetical protein
MDGIEEAKKKKKSPKKEKKSRTEQKGGAHATLPSSSAMAFPPHLNPVDKVDHP